MQEQLDRIEDKLDALIDALADEYDEEDQQFDLDGNPLGDVERDANESLD